MLTPPLDPQIPFHLQIPGVLSLIPKQNRRTRAQYPFSLFRCFDAGWSNAGNLNEVGEWVFGLASETFEYRLLWKTKKRRNSQGRDPTEHTPHGLKRNQLSLKDSSMLCSINRALGPSWAVHSSSTFFWVPVGEQPSTAQSSGKYIPRVGGILENFLQNPGSFELLSLVLIFLL